MFKSKFDPVAGSLPNKSKWLEKTRFISFENGAWLHERPPSFDRHGALFVFAISHSPVIG